jgi:hypothetical protein
MRTLPSKKRTFGVDELFKSADGKRKFGRKPFWQTANHYDKRKLFYQYKQSMKTAPPTEPTCLCSITY